MGHRRSPRYDRPVSEEELDAMPKKIDEAFDEIYELLADELGGDPEDYRAALDSTSGSRTSTMNSASTTVADENSSF
jgi:hypothetical protein